MGHYNPKKDKKIMNKLTREQLEKIKDKLYEIADELESLSADEQDKVDNLPENLQYSERADSFQESADNLQEQADNVNDIISNIDDIIGA